MPNVGKRVGVKRMCRVLIVPSLTLDCCQASSQWDEEASTDAVLVSDTHQAPRHWDSQTAWNSFWIGGKQAPGHQLSHCLVLHLACGFPLLSSGACVIFCGLMSSLGSGLLISSKPMESELIHICRKDATDLQRNGTTRIFVNLIYPPDGPWWPGVLEELGEPMFLLWLPKGWTSSWWYSNICI